MIRRLSESRWFGLADLACAALSGAWWYGQPDIGGWPLLLGLAPWAVRVGVGRFPFRRTPFDIPLLVFLVTAAVGVWAAYDPGPAWTKFWVIVGAVLIYYALAGQPHGNWWVVAGGLGVLGALVSADFLLAVDWSTVPADLPIITRIGLWWTSIRPTLPLRALHPNTAGGMMALLAAFPVAMGIRSWRAQRMLETAAAGALIGIIGVGLFLTSSRAAWLALAVGLSAWATWSLSGRLARRLGRAPWQVFTLAVVLLCAPALGFALTYTGGLEGLAKLLPGLPSGVSRLDLARNTLRLVADFPFTGGGLGAFPGLYSRYIMVIPVFLFGYSHNLFLDVALEQGVFGLLALVIMTLGAAWLLFTPRSRVPEHAGLIQGALLAGLVVRSLHGMGDDALYGSQGSPLLFVVSGMTVALTRPAGLLNPIERTTAVVTQAWPKLPRVALLAFIGLALAVLTYGLRQPMLAAWYANLGAVRMARAELAAWSDTVINEFGQPDRAAAELFVQALRWDADNRTALHRLGLIAMRQGDYSQAAIHLDAAYQADHGHRGVRKALGFTYVWLGQPDLAADLLAFVPEASDELSTYAWWWGTQGREDLAARAAQVAARLAGAAAPR